MNGRDDGTTLRGTIGGLEILQTKREPRGLAIDEDRTTPPLRGTAATFGQTHLHGQAHGLLGRRHEADRFDPIAVVRRVDQCGVLAACGARPERVVEAYAWRLESLRAFRQRIVLHGPRRRVQLDEHRLDDTRRCASPTFAAAASSPSAATRRFVRGLALDDNRVGHDPRRIARRQVRFDAVHAR